MNTTKTISLTLILLLSIPVFSLLDAYAVGEYIDKHGHTISFEEVEKSHNTTEEKPLFIEAFGNDYTTLEPNLIKPHFKTKDDILNWLANVYDIEYKYFQDATHPIKWIQISKDGKQVGFMIFEQWGDDPSTWHIRQSAILPEEQRQGYGTKLIDLIHSLVNGVETIVVDIRKTNTKAINFYKKYGFQQSGHPNDKELPDSHYIGMKWKS